MTKEQFRNLWRTYRKGHGLMSKADVLAWIGFYSVTDKLLKRLF